MFRCGKQLGEKNTDDSVSPMKKKTAMLLKTDVRKVNPEYSPGGERVFLDDAAAFIRHSMLTHAYIAGTLRRTSSVVGKKIKRIWYPYRIIDGIDECLYGSRMKFVADILLPVREAVYIFSELYYAAVFVLSERNADIYYVLDCPLVALLSPGKTILQFQNFHPGLAYIFAFKERLKKTTILFPSKSLMDEYIRRYPDINKKSCAVIPNAVDLSFFNVHHGTPGNITFLFASAWVKEKGIQYMDFIIRELNKKYQNKINFIIGGSIDLWSLSQRRYRDLRGIVLQTQGLAKIYSNVTLVGRVKRRDMPALYNSTTYLLFPSVWKEPCALTVLESLACGIPPVAFARGGTKEIIRSGENGYISPRVGKHFFLATLTHVIDTFNAQSYARMSGKCRESAKQFQVSRRMQAITRLPVFQ